MWLIRTALRRPYTFVVMAMLIAIGGGLSIKKTPTDIFPNIDIPVISVIWNYGGLPPEEMEKRIVNGFERFLTTIVSNIDHVESQTLTGIAVIKIYLQPDTNVAQAIAQTTAIAQTAVRQMPPGAIPPLIMQYSATSVPIMMLALQSDTLSEQQMFDYGINFIRSEIALIPGTQIPYPYGGKQRQIMVDIDPPRLHAWGLSPRDVQTALGQQNVILPSGTAKLGVNEYPVIISSTPESLEEIAGLPIRTVDGRTIYIRDVANVRDGNMPQTEEQRHGDLLALCVGGLGGELVQGTWTESLFVVARRLAGVKFKLVVLLAAETVGLAFYRGLTTRLPAGSLRTCIEEICADEVHHMKFHGDAFRGRRAFRYSFYAVVAVAAAVVLVDHRRTHRALGIPLAESVKRFYEQVRNVGDDLASAATTVHVDASAVTRSG